MFKHLKSKLVRVSEHLIYRVYKCCENLFFFKISLLLFKDLLVV